MVASKCREFQPTNSDWDRGGLEQKPGEMALAK